jgi:hypothetical protein
MRETEGGKKRDGTGFFNSARGRVGTRCRAASVPKATRRYAPAHGRPRSFSVSKTAIQNRRIYESDTLLISPLSLKPDDDSTNKLYHCVVLQHCLQGFSQIPLVCEILIPAIGLHRRSQNCTVISLTALRGGIETRSKNKVCCIQTKLQLSLKVKLHISNKKRSFTSVNTASEETLVLRFGTDLRHLLVTSFGVIYLQLLKITYPTSIQTLVA